MIEHPHFMLQIIHTKKIKYKIVDSYNVNNFMKSDTKNSKQTNHSAKCAESLLQFR